MQYLFIPLIPSSPSCYLTVRQAFNSVQTPYSCCFDSLPYTNAAIEVWSKPVYANQGTEVRAASGTRDKNRVTYKRSPGQKESGALDWLLEKPEVSSLGLTLRKIFST